MEGKFAGEKVEEDKPVEGTPEEGKPVEEDNQEQDNLEHDWVAGSHRELADLHGTSAE